MTTLAYSELPLAFMSDSNAREQLMHQGNSAKAHNPLFQRCLKHSGTELGRALSSNTFSKDHGLSAEVARSLTQPTLPGG